MADDALDRLLSRQGGAVR
ncbi:hypothetical protein KIPB_008082, partial [Kipferlia bialata]|eukprot:g8082.t1